MSASIFINFNGGNATANTVSIALANCSISPSQNQGVAIAMASALTNVTVLASQVSIATAFDAQFAGSLNVAINWASGQTPSVTLNNLQNAEHTPATVTWPTSSAPQTQILTPGVPMSLSGIVAS